MSIVERSGSRTDQQYADSIRQLEQQLALGKTLPELEDWIEALPGLDDEQRSALWFYALCCSDGSPEMRALRRVVVFGPVGSADGQVGGVSGA